MAAPCRLCGVLRIGFQLGQIERHARVAGHQVQQYRFKKGAGRFKAPPSHGEKENRFFMKRKSKVIVQEVERKDLKPAAEDDVWIEKYYEPLKHDISKAIQMHRDFCQPAMLNDPSAKLQLSMLLDLRTKKKTKFMNVIKKTVLLPHDFEDGPPNQVMVFVKDPDAQKIAQDLGAAFVGGMDLVKMIEKGEIRHDDFDHVVCHVDMMSEITSVRKFLRDIFPNKAKGNLGGDIRKMVSYFLSGKTYESEKLDEALGRVRVTLGTLDMADEQLVENHNAFIQAICSHRSAQLGPFITKGTLSCPPSPESLLIDPNQLRPVSERASQVKQLEQEEEVVKKEDEDDEDEPQAIEKSNS